MTEYIEREMILKEFAGIKIPDSIEYGLASELAVNIIKYAPAADVAPVRHGRWVKKHRHRGGFHRYTGLDDFGEQHTITVDERCEYDDLYCSECGKQSADNFLNYCPNCGAKMDKKN